MIPLGWLVAAAFLGFWVLLGALGQGIESYRAIQAGFQRELPVTACSPITGRTLPVPDLWAQYDRRK